MSADATREYEHCPYCNATIRDGWLDWHVVSRHQKGAMLRSVGLGLLIFGGIILIFSSLGCDWRELHRDGVDIRRYGYVEVKG